MYCMITDRQNKILAAIIEQYAEIAAPVGSVLLAKLFNVSSATIRTEMAVLENLGLITQPHTSAGRIPTDAGYRFYVNNLQNQAPRLAEKNSNDKSTKVLRARIDIANSAEQNIRSAVNTLVDLTHNLGIATIGDQLYLNGISNLFTQPEFMDPLVVQQVAKLIDNLEPWLREAEPNEPLNIFIGNENPIGKGAGVSLIISRFHSPYSDKSYIGVLGPTRQNYEKVMNLVSRTGLYLEEIL